MAGSVSVFNLCNEAAYVYVNAVQAGRVAGTVGLVASKLQTGPGIFARSQNQVMMRWDYFGGSFAVDLGHLVGGDPNDDLALYVAHDQYFVTSMRGYILLSGEVQHTS